MIRVPRVRAKDPATKLRRQRGPVVSSAEYSASTARFFTANPYHLPSVPSEPLDQWDHDRSCNIAYPRSSGPYNRYIGLILELWELGVVVLEDAEREWEACYIVQLIVLRDDSALYEPHSKASNTNAVTSIRHAAPPLSGSGREWPFESFCRSSCVVSSCTDCGCATGTWISSNS